MSLEVGQVLGGQYLIERVIGRGSMGLVYKGRDTKTAETVAIRLVLPEFDNERVPAFFENDAKVVGQLNSEHIARLYNMGFLPSGERCLVGEYVEGESLQRRLRRLGHLSELAVAQLLIQLLECLSAAHDAGVVHRDLTPLSIFVISQGAGAGDAIKLIDFGISRLQLLTANPDSPPVAIAKEMESFQYLSPEQLNGLREIDPRSNIYTLGVIAYEAITGRLPFVGKDFGDLTFNILQGDPPSVEELAPESSSPFSQLISKAMARSPNARFQYAEEMYAAISNWAIRAGISKSKLESGVTDWRGPDLEVPVTSERPSTLSAAASTLANGREAPVGDEPPLPSQVATLGPDIDQTVAPLPAVPAPIAEPAAMPFKVNEPSTLDFFPQQSSLGLAEEDALFGAPPTAPRDELPFVALDALSTGEPSTEPVERAIESGSVPSALPQVEPNPVPSAVWREPVAEPAPTYPVAETPVQSELVPVEVKRIVLTPAPVAGAGEDSVSDDDPDAAFRPARTILGIGGVGVRPAQIPAQGSAGVVASAPPIPAEIARPEPPPVEAAPAPFRPRQATEPGIYATPTPAPAVPIEPPAPSAQPATISQPQAPQAVAASAPAVVVAAAVPAALMVSEPAKTQPSKQVEVPAAVVARAAAPSLSDEGAPFARKRSKKPLLVALLLLAIAGVAIAVSYVQHGPETKAGAAEASASVNAIAPAAPVPPAPAASATAIAEPAVSADVRPAVSAAEVGAKSAQTKPPRPGRPAQVSQPSSASVPVKQGTYKGSVAKDPYNYR